MNKVLTYDEEFVNHQWCIVVLKELLRFKFIKDFKMNETNQYHLYMMHSEGTILKFIDSIYIEIYISGLIQVNTFTVSE